MKSKKPRPTSAVALAAGKRSLLELLDKVRVRRVEIPEGFSFENINTRADYRKLLGGPPRPGRP